MKKFERAMTGVAEIYGEKITEERLLGYCSVLSDFDPEILVKALQIHTRQSKWFPLPADLINIIEGEGCSLKPEAFKSFADVLKNLSDPEWISNACQGDKRIATAIEACGGWYTMRHGTEDTKWQRQTFVEAFIGEGQQMKKDDNFDLLPRGKDSKVIAEDTARRLK